MLLPRIDQLGNAAPEFTDRCVGCEGKHDFRTPGSRKPEFAFSTSEAVDLPALADKEFVFNSAILPMPFGGSAEFLEYHFTRQHGGSATQIVSRDQFVVARELNGCRRVGRVLGLAGAWVIHSLAAQVVAGPWAETRQGPSLRTGHNRETVPKPPLVHRIP
jgi:hypothetical protein